MGGKKGERKLKLLSRSARVWAKADATEYGGKLLPVTLSGRICACGRCRPCIVVEITASARVGLPMRSPYRKQEAVMPIKEEATIVKFAINCSIMTIYLSMILICVNLGKHGYHV